MLASQLAVIRNTHWFKAEKMESRSINRFLKVILFTLVGLTFLWYIYSLNEIRRPTLFGRALAPVIKSAPLAQKQNDDQVNFNGSSSLIYVFKPLDHLLQIKSSDYEVIQTTKHIENTETLKHERIVPNNRSRINKIKQVKEPNNFYLFSAA